MVCISGLLDVITDAKEQKSTERLVQSDLSDDFIETLAEELFSHGAEASRASLSLEQFLVEKLTQASDIDTCGILMGDLLDEMLALFDPLARGQDLVKNLFGADWAVLHRGQLTASAVGCYRKSMSMVSWRMVVWTYFDRRFC